MPDFEDPSYDFTTMGNRITPPEKSNAQLPIAHTTKVKIQVDSHNFGKFYISDAVLSFQFEKSIIDSGSMVLTLAPYREWRDLLSANDIINVYVKLNNADEKVIYNKGWVRLFFGYINDVRSNESVDSEGNFTIRYNVTCSDFQKVFDKTEVYNNPYLRTDENYGNNLVGSYLFQMGVIDQGNPRFLVMNHIVALLGFGRQWLLPLHYNEQLASAVNTSSQSPSLTTNFATTRVKNDVFKAVQELRHLAERFVYLYAAGSANQAYIDGVEAANSILADLGAFAEESGIPTTAEELSDTTTATNALRQRLELALGFAPSNLPKVQQTIDPVMPLATPRTIYDIISFDYMEYADGFLVKTMIFEYAGALINLLKEDSHDVLNELIFDLRPSADFYRGAKDGLGNPLDGAVAMVPSVVLRERPFTTYPPNTITGRPEIQGDQIIDRIQDMQDIRPDVGTTVATPSDAKPSSVIGSLLPTHVDWGGPVWTQLGRIIDYGPSVGMNSEAIFTNTLDGGDVSAIGLINRGPRTLENIQITSNDVLSASLGRGDQDVLTGFDFIPITENGEDQVFYQRDISPQFRHLLIRRHGLRMMLRTSEYSGPAIPGVGGAFAKASVDLGPTRSGEPATIKARQIASSFSAYMTLRIVTITDHWYQHNLEYLNGTITLRPFPGLRVGYRLDWVDRDLSFYVESVQHQWAYPNLMTTTVKVTRGQPLSKPLKYIKPDDRVRIEKTNSVRLGINYPVADISYMDSDTRKRVGPPPGHPGRFSPSILHQNLNTAVATGISETSLNIPYTDGVNRAGRDDKLVTDNLPDEPSII